MARSFGFSDLHSFKDYVGFVQLCAPDDFTHEETVGPEDQWPINRALEGLWLGLKMAAEQKDERAEFERGRVLVEEAYAAYRDARIWDGFFKFDELQKLLSRVPSLSSLLWGCASLGATD